MPQRKRPQMGEVHVSVRLSNATDVELAERGLMEPDQVRTCEVDALVDTGATKSIMAIHVAAQLGLTIRRQTLGQLADGTRVPVGVSSTVRFEISGRETLED